MKEHTSEKLLIQLNENSIFYKMKKFFLKLFYRNNISDVFEKTNNKIENEKIKKSFIEELKNVENEETKLLKLQKQYRSGEINEEDLTNEQIKSLCELYDKQIEKLEKSNEIRKQRLEKYRKKV